MKRRDLLKSLAVLGGVAVLPSLLTGRPLISTAGANVSARALREARALVMDSIGYTQPQRMPQIISIFLYGGPSELAGNLTNIVEINKYSQNPYPANLLVTTPAPNQDPANFAPVTPNFFWRDAGGREMEWMLARRQLSVYRTLNRTRDDTKAHRPSIFSNLTGRMGEDDSRPGVATNIAAILDANNAIAPDALFPFVTFDGDSLLFNQGDATISPRLKPMSLNDQLRNPYVRQNNPLSTNMTLDAQIEQLAKTVSSAGGDRYKKVIEAFEKRATISDFIQNRLGSAAITSEFDDPFNPGTTVSYDANSAFGRRLRAAVNLVINNPDTLMVSMGSDGLGGWDDHDSALDEYTPRMRSLMAALDVASKHLRSANKDNVLILVFGDFGRNVNLNGSMGWDHGNNQNLYVVSGGTQLGNVVGETVWTGTPKENRQFTTPAPNSVQYEPFAVAATIYKAFGVQNPQLLTDNVGAIPGL